MQRVAVVGSPGAGKSTFSRQLADRSGLPLIHLDWNFWSPGWIETSPEEWLVKQSALVEGERWIIDGNYSNTFEVRFTRADTVIVLSAPRRVCLARVLRRVVRDWGNDTQAPGCPEHLDLAFLRMLWTFPKRSVPRLEEALARVEHELTVVRLATRGDATDFLRRVEAN
ncbi:MAG TPA: AAA family ATPase [Acidimicrobiales bacterium]